MLLAVIAIVMKCSGVATTGVAALKLGRRFVGVELVRGFVRLGNDNLQAAVAQRNWIAENGRAGFDGLGLDQPWRSAVYTRSPLRLVMDVNNDRWEWSVLQCKQSTGIDEHTRPVSAVLNSAQSSLLAMKNPQAAE